jgi:raffinose/stachyose/melibiose transport system substrate-binding protein
MIKEAFMRKATVLLGVLLLLAVPLVFSGGQGEAAKGGKITLTMYAYNERTSPVEAPNWDYVLKAFLAQYPNIDLKIEFGFTEPYHNKLQAKLVAGQIDDISFLWPDKRTGKVTGSGMIKDLRPWLKGHENEFVPGALVPQGPNGEIYELPEQVTDCHVMYTNTKLLKDLGFTFPKTLDELLAQGPKILAADMIPIAMDNKDGWQMQSCLLGALVERTGGKAWFDKAIKGNGASFSDPEFVNALAVIDALARNKMFSPGINQASYGVAVTDFANEKALYTIDGGWRVNAFKGVLTPEQKEVVELFTFPNTPNMKGTPNSTSTVTGTGYGMSNKLTGAKAEAAWAWIWFYSGPVGSAIRQGFGALPAYKMPPRTDLDLMIQKLAAFVAKTPGGYVVDSVMDAEGMGGVLHPLLQELIFGQKTPKQVADTYETWVKANDSGRKK